MVITVEDIRALGVCDVQVESFTTSYPNGLEIPKKPTPASRKSEQLLMWFFRQTRDEKFLTEGSRSAEMDVLLGVAHNPAISQEIRKRLLRSRFHNVRSVAVQTAPEQDHAWVVLVPGCATLMAQNATTSPEVLRNLAHNPKHRADLAGNPSMPSDVLRDWVEDQKLHRFLAKNPATPDDAIRFLVNFRHKASKTYQCPTCDGRRRLSSQHREAFVQQERDNLWLCIARRSHLPKDIAIKLVTEGREEVQKEIGASLKDPTVLRELMSSRSSDSFLMGLVHNPDTPEDVLDNILTLHPSFRREVAKHSKTSEVTLHRLYHSNDWWVAREAKDNMIRRGKPFVCLSGPHS